MQGGRNYLLTLDHLPSRTRTFTQVSIHYRTSQVRHRNLHLVRRVGQPRSLRASSKRGLVALLGRNCRMEPRAREREFRSLPSSEIYTCESQNAKIREVLRHPRSRSKDQPHATYHTYELKGSPLCLSRRVFRCRLRSVTSRSSSRKRRKSGSSLWRLSAAGRHPPVNLWRAIVLLRAWARTFVTVS